MPFCRDETRNSARTHSPHRALAGLSIKKMRRLESHCSTALMAGVSLQRLLDNENAANVTRQRASTGFSRMAKSRQKHGIATR